MVESYILCISESWVSFPYWGKGAREGRGHTDSNYGAVSFLHRLHPLSCQLQSWILSKKKKCVSMFAQRAETPNTK